MEAADDCPRCRPLDPVEQYIIAGAINNHVDWHKAVQCRQARDWLLTISQARTGIGINDDWNWFETYMGHSITHQPTWHLAVSGGVFTWQSQSIAWGLMHEYAHHAWGYVDERLADEFASYCLRW